MSWLGRSVSQPSAHELAGGNSRDAHVRGTLLIQRPLDDVLRVLDQLRGHIVVVFRVKVPDDDMVAERRHGGLAGGAARDVRRPHVRGVAPEDGQERLLVADHLVAPRGLGHGRQVGVRPRVRAELVSFVVYALNQRAPDGGAVNGALVEVVAAGTGSVAAEGKCSGEACVTKKVALTPLVFSKSSSAAVYVYGPSSNVLATGQRVILHDGLHNTHSAMVPGFVHA
jgi:hypothetical protein